MSVKDLFAKLKGKPASLPESEEDKPKVVNGYLQTSNTRVIRPAYSNTREGRAAQEAKAKAKAGANDTDTKD